MSSYQNASTKEYSGKGYTINWLKDKKGHEVQSIIVQKFDGKFIWNDWQKNEIKLKYMLDSIEKKYKELDKKEGYFHTVGFIVDITKIDLSMIRPLSILQQTAHAQNFEHPRAGDTVVIGWSKNYRSFSTSMVVVVLDIFSVAFPNLSQKIHKAENMGDALNILKYRN